jgi:hypothetical protein
MAIDKSGHRGHLAGVDYLRALAAERLHFFVCPNRNETTVLHRNRIGEGHLWIDRMHLGIQYDKIRILGYAGCRKLPADREAGKCPSTSLNEVSAVIPLTGHKGILAGIELPLLLRDSRNPGIEFLDTTVIHVGAIVDELLN